jgi:hypothetical protein
MFAKIRRFCYPKVVPVIKKSQHQLDQLRIAYADNQLMQLHLDRMQTAQDAKTA